MDGRTHKLEYTNMDYSSAMKRNGVLIHATTWVNLENIMLKNNQSQKISYCMVPFV